VHISIRSGDLVKAEQVVATIHPEAPPSTDPTKDQAEDPTKDLTKDSTNTGKGA
jgi:acetyl-CoA/propionyl-CoA carboxylase biotin carboxyl carrier protein